MVSVFRCNFTAFSWRFTPRDFIININPFLYNFASLNFKTMKTSVEISYYPLQEEYIPAIMEFIDRLKKYEDIQMQINGMSTQVFGEFRPVMKAITTEIENAFTIPSSVFILKIINSDLQTYTQIDERTN